MPNQNILRRTALNNPKIRNSAASRTAKDSILSCIKTSDSPNSTYGLDDFNRGMMWATTTGSSVGSVASAVRNRIERITGADTHHRTVPTDEWFNGMLSKTDKAEMMNDFASSVRVQLDTMHELGQVAKEGGDDNCNGYAPDPAMGQKTGHGPCALKKKERDWSV